MYQKGIQQTLCALLVFAAVSGTVAPSFVYAATVSNTVQATATTGGQSIDGRDGEDGKDGRNGADGEDGKNIVSGSSSASVHIETFVNGEKVIDVHASEDGAGGAPAHAVADGEYDGVANVHVSAAALSASDQTELQRTLSAIRLILLSYVNKLF